MNIVEESGINNSAMTLPSGSNAGCFYIPSDKHKLFTWLQLPAEAEHVRGVAVLCTSLGYEYMSLHRSVRALANRLADEGIASLRFDYRDTGDSSGESFGEGQVKGFVTDVTSVIDKAHSLFDGAPVILVGIGLGGTFAALAAETKAVDTLVLWNASVNGRKFVREQQMLSKMLNKSQSVTDDGVIDAAGIVMPPSMIDELKAINLTKREKLLCRHALVLARDDMPEDRSFADAISASGVDVEYSQVPGYADMVTFPTDTKIPGLAIDKLIASLRLPEVTDHGKLDDLQQLLVSEPRRLQSNAEGQVTGLEEQPVIFGRQSRLFGIDSYSKSAPAAKESDAAIVFIDCGSEHHVGPHRLYTDLSRRFARQGLHCFRFDIEGIGDSPASGGNEDNYSYSPVVLQDIEDALTHLQSSYGCKRFVLTGICSGAYHSFRAAVDLQGFSIAGSILINPLVFDWDYSAHPDVDVVESHSLYNEVAYYREALFQLSSWLKLLRGGVDLSHLMRVGLKQAGVMTQGLFNRFIGLFGRDEATKLATEIRACLAADRKLSMIFAEGDPGYLIVSAEAPKAVSNGVQRNMMSVDFVKDSDHGFSMSYMRRGLVDVFEQRVTFILKN